MPRPKRTEEPKAPTTPERQPIGTSYFYAIRKYGLYAYEVVRLEPDTYVETKVGVENIYGVVASDLVDLMFREISGETK